MLNLMMNVEWRGVGMINMDNFVKSKQIKCICKIINSEMDSWNAINKHWLKKYDNTFGGVFFFFVSAPIILSVYF
jgi:hypothetical protein